MKNTQTKKTVYRVITDRVIEGLQTQGMKWFKPWTNKTGDIVSPTNYITKIAYRGVNALLLAQAMRQHGWTTPLFITAKQVKTAGAELKEGAQSAEVIYWMVSYVLDGKWYSEYSFRKAGYKPEDADNDHWSPRYYRVYNIADTSIDYVQAPVECEVKYERIPVAESVWDTYSNKPTLMHGGMDAYYRPSADHIQMPKIENFKSRDDYYKTLYHEAVHSTGHKSRLNRKGVAEINNFGSKDYSYEELVAELGSMYLVAMTGLEPVDNDANSQAYINGWIAKLNSEEKWILSASTKAEKAVEHIVS